MKGANVALLQLSSGDNTHANLAQIEQQIKQLNSSIKLVMTPENAVLFSKAEQYQQQAESEGNGPLQRAISEMAQRYGVWILLGSMPLISRENNRQVTSSSLLFDHQGKLQARYDKLHMFDVDLDDSHEHYCESAIYQHGETLTVVDTPVGKLGMTICYDLRFAGLFQALRAKGAELIAVPAAFTRVTGEAHWEVLLRARAIETQCYLLAPAQVGRHGTRTTWGHTMAVDAWGGILAQNADTVGTVTVNISSASLKSIRKQIPVAQHNRFQPMLVNLLLHRESSL